jgi:hypothetical protein
VVVVGLTLGLGAGAASAAPAKDINVTVTRPVVQPMGSVTGPTVLVQDGKDRIFALTGVHVNLAVTPPIVRPPTNIPPAIP